MEIGDRVKAIRAYDNNTSIVGKYGEVIEKYKSFLIVQFDCEILWGHRGFNGNGIIGHCWNIPESYLELENRYLVDLI